MKVAIIGDSWGFGLLETKPDPLWQRRFNALRNKALLVPDYGAMYVTAFIKERSLPGVDLQVINLVADIFQAKALFEDRGEGPGEEATDCPLSEAGRVAEAHDYFRRSLVDYQPDVVLFPLSIYYIALHAREMLRRVKEILPDCFLVTGGVYSTLHPQEILEDGAADFVVRGEGEWTTLELLDALSRGEREFHHVDGLSWRADGRIYHNRERKREENIDRFPHIYTVSEEFRIGLRHRLLKELIPFNDYIPGAGFLTSRGCPEQCTFCLDPAIWKRKTRFHSPQYVREVVKYCWEHFVGGERSFYFGDATFALNRRRLFQLIDLVEKIPFSYNIQTRADSLVLPVLERLAAARFATVAIGAESFNDRILQEVVRKRTNREEILRAVREVRGFGMKPILTFIVGLPGEKRASIEHTLEILRREGIRDAVFFPLVVFRGTELYRYLVENFSPEQREHLRLNPWSEEYCLVNEEFPTVPELVDYADSLNRAVRQF